MNKFSERNVVKNASWIVLGKLFQSVLQVVILMVMARHLGAADFGIVNYAMALVVFVTPLAFIGFNNTIVNEIINKPSQEGVVIGTSITLSIISSLICGLLIILFVAFADAGNKKLITVCGLYSLVLIFQSVELIKYWFQARLQSKYVSVVSLLSYTLIAIYNILGFLLGKDVYWFVLSNVIAFCIMSGLLMVLYFKLKGERLSFSKKIGKNLVQKSKHFIIPGFMLAIYAQSDKIMIQSYVGDSAVGLYSAAFTAASLASFVFVAIIDSYRPVIFSYYSKSRMKFDYFFKKLSSIVIYFSLLMAIFTYALSELIIWVLFGEEFDSAVGSLRILCWYIMFAFLGSIRNIWILSNGLQRYLLVVSIFGAFLNVFMNFILIPLYGIEGAAVASLFTQVVVNFGITYLIKPLHECNKLVIGGVNPRYLRSILKKIYLMSGNR